MAAVRLNVGFLSMPLEFSEKSLKNAPEIPVDSLEALVISLSLMGLFRLIVAHSFTRTSGAFWTLEAL